tara:strand:+ start:104 stop:472 length:369 start_codon:yes stop_codon:yes gene_type:complete
MGSKNQLFRRNPDRYIISDLLKIFNIESLDDTNFYFTKQDLLNLDIIDNMNKLKNRLEVYYIPCKSKVYLNDIDVKKCITILRQFLKYMDYNLKLKEKYLNGVKNYQYFIVCNKKKVVIEFD